MVTCLLLNVFQSVEVNCPDWEVVAFCKVRFKEGVVVALLKEPVKPFTELTDTVVTVPALLVYPAGLLEL